MLKNLLISVFTLVFILPSFADKGSTGFEENKGQFPEKVHYRMGVPNGDLFLERGGLTYFFRSGEDIDRIHELHHHNKTPEPEDLKIDCHVFKVNFIGANREAKTTYSGKKQDYINYYTGSKRITNVKKYDKVNYQNLYNGIDLSYYTKEGFLKYDFTVNPNADPSLIKLKYSGHDNIKVKNGELHIKTSVNKVIEQKPFAYQIINGLKKEVPCNYKLVGNELRFDFPSGYDEKLPLIIDPVLVFATYSGGSGDNWGYTATFDQGGHAYGGGIALKYSASNGSYPTTTGAFQTSFGGGSGSFSTDIVITKYAPDGSSLVYSTYLGGSANESPHSLVVNSQDELLVLGTTSSSNFPMTTSSYDNTFNGGNNVSASSISYSNGSDIIVSKFNTSGTSLLGSTFVGGSGNEGLNLSGSLAYNYGDEFRGEIIVDSSDNCYIASMTYSTDFPVTAGAYQTAKNPSQDACVFKLNSDMSSLLWSTYLGGSGDDAAYSIQLDQNNLAVVTGGTQSSNFPTSSSALNTSIQGGVDGFITKLTNDGTTLTNSTFLGTGNYDQSYFVQLDDSNNIYVVGQTTGNYPVSAGVYSNPNSGQFIHKLDNSLSTSLISTVFGTGTSSTSTVTVDIALSAFLINKCNYIFISGWGGQTNNSAQASNSTTTGLPITPNALQTTTDGSDYYLMILTDNADSLLHASFFGGSVSAEHVDGGTSRFDERGIVYQAVCAGCGGNSDFPTTSGAWSQTNNSNNCNIGVFKFDLSNLTAEADVYGQPYACVGDTLDFLNLSNGGVYYDWYMGDGTQISTFEPSHAFSSSGVYQVMLVVTDSVSCIITDTAYVDITIAPEVQAQVSPPDSICEGDTTQVTSSGGTSYQWLPATDISNPNISNPLVYPKTTTTYSVIVSDSCGKDTAEVSIWVYPDNTSLSGDEFICIGDSVQLQANGGVSYSWSPAKGLSDSTISNPFAKPDTTTTYTVEITNTQGCSYIDSLQVVVDTNPPSSKTSGNTMICRGDSVEIWASGGSSYSWQPAKWVNNPGIKNPTVSPKDTTTFYVTVTNACGSVTDSITVFVHQAEGQAFGDTTVCPDNTAFLSAEGGVYYVWRPGKFVNSVNNETGTAVVNPDKPRAFVVTLTDSLGCKTKDTVYVDHYPIPEVDVGEDQLIDENGNNLFTENQGISYLWEPSYALSCDTCPATLAYPDTTTTYTLTLTDENGCVNSDNITIFVYSSFYVPNTFTPDGDGKNDVFYAYGTRIVEFEMDIYNRWGEHLFHSDDINEGWDGVYNGSVVKTGTYVWKIFYEESDGKRNIIYGNVNVLK